MSANRLLLWLVALALLIVHYDYPAFRSPNESSRLYLLEALSSRGSIAIDPEIQRHGDIEDKLVFAGRTLSNKPPGLTLLALPAYAAATIAWRQVTGRELPWGAALYVARVSAVTLPTLLWLGLLRRRLEADVSLPSRTATTLLAGAALGTGLLPYGALFMSHATSAALLGIASIMIFSPTGTGNHALALTSLLCGLAAACEYPAVLVGAVLLVAAALRARRVSAVLAIVAGLLPGVALVFVYNYACFGNPLDLGYGHHTDPNFARVHASGVMGFSPPTPSSLYGLLLSPARGLFVWSPLLLLALPGALRLMRDRDRRAEAWTLAISATAAIAFIAGYPNWHGGWAAGPRYLMPAVPALVLLAAAAGARWSRLAPGLAACGVLGYGVASLGFPFYPELLANPLRDLGIPLLRWRQFAPTLAPGPWLGPALLASAIGTVMALALRARPFAGVTVACAWLALTLPRAGKSPGPVMFVQGEVLYRMGERAMAARRFGVVLATEHPSPAMAAWTRARLAEIQGETVLPPLVVSP